MADRYASLDAYDLRHLFAHLERSDRIASALALLLDLQYLEAKTAAGLTTELIEEFTRAQQVTCLPGGVLRPLRDVLHRERHFLVRHPTMVFQTLWNLCWWYRVPETRPPPHDAPELGCQAIRSPEDGDFPLRELLRSWRAELGTRVTPHHWARSLTPPRVPLGSGGRLIIRMAERLTSDTIAYSPDGTRILGGIGSKVLEWDARYGTELRAFHADHPTSSVTCVCYSTEGERVAAGDNRGVVRVWDRATRSSSEYRPVRATDAYVAAVTFSHDGEFLVARLSNGDTHCWSSTGGGTVAEFPTRRRAEDRTGMTSACLISQPGSSRVFVPDEFGPVRVVDLDAKRNVCDLRGHESEIRGCSISQNGEWLLTAGGRAVRLWHLAGEEIRQTRCILEESAAVGPCVLSPDAGTAVYIGGRELKFVNTATGTPLGGLPLSDLATWLAVSPDGSSVAALLLNGSIEVLSAEPVPPDAPTDGRAGWIRCLSCSPVGPQLAATTANGGVHLWSTATGDRATGEFQHDSPVSSLAWSADGTKLAIAGYTVHVYSYGVRGRRDDWMSAFPSMQIHHVLAESSSCIRVFDIRSREKVVDLRLDACEVTAVGLTADGQRLAVATDDHRISIFDRTDAGGMARTLVIEHEKTLVWSLAFSPDGGRLACGSGYFRSTDAAWVLVWDVSPGSADRQDEFVARACAGGIEVQDQSLGLRTHKLLGHQFAVTGLSFSSDGRYLASGSLFEAARIWDLELGSTIGMSSAPTDPVALLMGPERAPFHLASGRNELEVRCARTGEVLAWWPSALSGDDLVRLDASGRVWALADSDHLALLVIENG